MYGGTHEFSVQIPNQRRLSSAFPSQYVRTHVYAHVYARNAKVQC